MSVEADTTFKKRVLLNQIKTLISKFMIKILQFQGKLLLIAFFLALTGQSFYMQAQSVQRQGISSYGVTGIQGGTTLMQTVGQPYNTSAFYGNETSVLPGFQQPVVFEIKDVTPEPLRRLNLHVYPNPASYYVTIESRESLENSFIRVTDMQGRIILDRQVTHLQEYTINCETWANGIYVITVSDGNQIVSSLRLIIKK
jgi:hypothetical protein